MAATIGHCTKLKIMCHFTIQYSVAPLQSLSLSSTSSANQPLATLVNKVLLA